MINNNNEQFPRGVEATVSPIIENKKGRKISIDLTKDLLNSLEMVKTHKESELLAKKIYKTKKISELFIESIASI